jgi:hypothetical protein
MTITYYLFLDKAFLIQDVYKNLQMNILEPGIIYKEIKENSILPQYIVLESIYKDGYLFELIQKELHEMGYNKQFKLLKPLVT